MALTTFTAAQVLTAAQLNAVQANDYNQTVSTKTASHTLVAADKGTRIVMNVASSNTVTVNTSLFTAGDTLVIQNIGAGVTTVTAGTATVSSAGPLAIPQNGSGLLYFTSASVSIFYPSAVTVAAPASSGLVCIQSQTAFSAVSSVTVDSIFTSTYTNYKIMIEYQTSTTNDVVLQFRAAGTASTTGYNAQRFISSGASSFPTAENATSSFAILNNTDGAFLGFGDINLWAPQLAQPTSLQSLMNQPNTAYSTLYAGYRFGVHNVSTAFDGFIFSVASGTFTGKYTVYGFAKAV